MFIWTSASSWQNRKAYAWRILITCSFRSLHKKLEKRYSKRIFVQNSPVLLCTFLSGPPELLFSYENLTFGLFLYKHLCIKRATDVLHFGKVGNQIHGVHLQTIVYLWLSYIDFYICRKRNYGRFFGIVLVE